MSRALRAGAVVVAGSAAVLMTAVPAFAHVTVHPATAPAAAYTEIVVRVPDESADARTTKLEVQLPAAHPLTSVSVHQLPGWATAIVKSTLDKPIVTDDGTTTSYVSAVTWTATGDGIPPGSYESFAISAGPLPTAGTALTIPAVQTYSDGTVVSWDQPQPAGSPEPGHPAPVLEVTGPSVDSGQPAAASSTPPSPPASVKTTSAAATSDQTARGLGVAGLVVGTLGLGTAVLALRRRRAAGGG